MKKKRRKTSPGQEWVTRRNWTKGKFAGMAANLQNTYESGILTSTEVTAVKTALITIRGILYFWEGNRLASKVEYLHRKEDGRGHKG